MKIKVCNEDGGAKVSIVKPGAEGEDDTIVSESTVEVGCEVELTMPGLSDESGIQLGDVTESAQPA